jgi:hypothetical protein
MHGHFVPLAHGDGRCNTAAIRALSTGTCGALARRRPHTHVEIAAMNLRRELFATHIFEPLFLPALIAGGLLISIVGAYVTINQQDRSAEMGARSESDESDVVSGRHCSDRCACRSRREADGNADAHAGEGEPQN